MVARDDLGNRLRAHRIAASLSQEELSGKSGVSVRTISDLERGRTRWPHPGSVHRLADALELTGPARAEFIAAASRRLPGTAAGKPRPAGSARVLPRQLPAALPAFAGRSGELTNLSNLLANPGGTVVISAIGGTAGVGKTALALHWGHLVADEFPDGQLYVNLRGFDPSGKPTDPADAVRALLEGLSIPTDQLPHTDEAQVNLYRSLLVGKRMLVVLDNARDEAQVRPLLPGSATCRVVVTSRNLLAGLTALDAAHPLLLDVLPEADAWDLLEQRLGPQRLHADDGATYQVIKASACLPLALSIIAAQATLRPYASISDIAAELAASHGLDAFTVGEPAADIRAVLSWSYRQLDGVTAQVFRLTGLHPGPDFDRYSAATLADLTPDQAEQALEVLTDSGLMQRARPGRYSMHDLLREYSRELSATHDRDQDRRTALTGLFGFYLHTAYAASAVTFPSDSQHMPRVPAPATAVPPFADHMAAREWLDIELSSLVAISAYAAEHRWLSHAAEMSATLHIYLHIDHHYAEAISIHRHALKAAVLADDQSAAGAAHFGLAAVAFRQGRFVDAIDSYQQSLRCYEQAGDQAGQIRARHYISNAYQTQGQYRQAAGNLRAALEFYRETGDRVMEGRALYDFGFLYLRMGRFSRAPHFLDQALAIYQESGDRRIQAHLLMTTGALDWRLGHSRRAADRWQEALAITRERGDRRGEAKVLAYLGVASLGHGDYDHGVSHLQEAITLSREIDYRHGEADALGDLGLARLRQGEHQAALSDLRQALAMARELQEPELTATQLNNLGEAMLAIRQPAESMERHSEALTVAVNSDEYQTARAQAGLGSAHNALGNRAEAVRYWRLAHDAYIKMGVPEAEDIRRLLDM